MASYTDLVVTDITVTNDSNRGGTPSPAQVNAVTAEIETDVNAIVAEIETSVTALEAGAMKVARLDVAFADMTAAALTQTFDVVTPSATQDAVIIDAFVYTTTLVSGGTIDAATIEVGNDESTADPNAYVLSTDVFTGASTGYGGLLYTTKGVDLVTVNTADYGRNTAVLSATQKVQVKLTTGTGNVVAATAGAFSVFVLYRLLPV